MVATTMAMSMAMSMERGPGTAPAAARPRAFVVAIVGAESSGKTQLAAALHERLAAGGVPVAVVAEYLREFCDASGRTPERHEQAAIAAEQTRRIDAACRALSGAAPEAGPTRDGVVIADTTALMTAVYSDIVFGDASLYASAGRDHARCDLTLLTALDLPWQADGIQRTGEHVRGPIDARVRAALRRAGVAYAVVGGAGAARADAAWQALRQALAAHAALSCPNC
jgi:nicotinamide riboside kinase